VNIEDAWHHGGAVLRAVDDQCLRLAAARKAADSAGIPLFINARIDTFLRGAGGVADTLARAHAYLAAGADGVFVPGVVDPTTVSAFVAKIPAPINVLVGPTAPNIRVLASLGVARISLGSAVAEAAYAVARRVTREALTTGTYDALAGALDYGELNTLMSRYRS
jgi:2-methylisocitrate lyase-like PEP mutase family enzyme